MNSPVCSNSGATLKRPSARSRPKCERVYAELTAYMNSLPRHDYGLIHGDYRPGNVIWDGATARTIDFDEPNFHWYIADVSRALMELTDQPLDARRRFREAFMRGYRSRHRIDESWVTQLPFFAQHRAMLMHMWDIQEGGGWSSAAGVDAEQGGVVGDLQIGLENC